MSTAITAPELGETIAAAMRDLYDELRAIVDRGPTDDPGLLDEIGKLTGRIRGRITRARKKAQPAEEPATTVTPTATQPTEEPAASVVENTKQVVTEVAAPVRTPATPADTTPVKPAHDPVSDARVAVDAPTVPRHRAVSVPARRTDAVTVRLPRPGAHGRHRQRSTRLPLWVHALVALLLVVGVVLAATGSPFVLAGVSAGAVLLGAARQWTTRRRANLSGVR